MKISLYLFSLLIFTKLVYAQSGPAGVEQTNGASNLLLWLNANENVEEAVGDLAENGDAISRWLDNSGYGNHAVSVNSPNYYTNQYNGNAAVFFNGSNDNLSLTPTQLPTGTSARTYIFIAESIETSNQNLMDHGLGGASGARVTITHMDTESSLAVNGHRWGSNFTSNTDLRISTFDLAASSTSNQINIYTNAGGLTESNLAGSSQSVNTGTTYAHIGTSNSGSSYFSGDITEIIIFDKQLNSAEFIILHNYLAAKYDIALSANDIYNEDDSGAGDFDHEVAGIGRVDASNLLDDAQGTSIVRILNPTDLGDDEFLIWGHNNGTQSAIEESDVPSDVEARFERIWKVSEVNTSSSSIDVGSIDIRFDLTDLGPVTTTDLRLLIDTDNDGIFSDETAISGASSLGGDVYQFSAVSGIADNLSFTLGTADVSQTPLPVNLLAFKASIVNEKHVRLDWQTLSERNNDYFSLERSDSGVEWENIANIPGAGNYSSLSTYSHTDYLPYDGLSYYRLKQIDFDGRFSFSPIKQVNIETRLKQAVSLAPNPVSGILILEGNPQDLRNIEVYNSLGQALPIEANFSENSERRLSIDLSSFSPRIYYIKTASSYNKILKR
ncbi:MAG: T9SS type A sorting domain-containing protein [Bacteroidota bacterium]